MDIQPSSPNSPTVILRRPWDDFLEGWVWKQGEHITLLGPTWAGKTTLALELLPRRTWIVVFAVKRRDETLDPLLQDGYRIERKWPPDDPTFKKIILWPKMLKPEDQLKQRIVFRNALNDIYRRGGWTVYLDEVSYVADDLRLRRHVRVLWQQARSMQATVVAGAQRPAYVPLEAYSQARHLFIFHGSDWHDLKRLGEIGGGMDRRAIANAIHGLDMYEFLYIDTRTGEMVTSRVDA